MEAEILGTIAALVLLLVASAFFSGSETSLTAASRARMHGLEQQGNMRAYLVNLLLKDKERLIGAILLGNNLVNIMASALATALLVKLFGDAGVAVATVAVTLLVLVFAEVLPKTYAIHHADAAALTVAPVLRPLVLVLGPVTQMVQWIVRATMMLINVRIEPGPMLVQSEEELRGAIDLHAHAGEEEKHEREMLRSILDLADIAVFDIMTHRKDVIMTNVAQPPAEIVSIVLDSPYTRVPIWQDKPENIVGVLHAKALLRAVQKSSGTLDELDIMGIAGEPWFIPETTDLFSQLQAFRSRHEHFAIVVDEYGEFLGIVTLEDILEEIVGEISDEHDIEMVGVRLLRDGSIVVDGKVTLRDLNRRFGWRLPDAEAATIAGLVLYEARRIPEVGQVFSFYGFRFEILGRQRNQISEIKITPVSPETDGEEEEHQETADKEG